MQIEIEVTSGTNKTVRSNVKISGQLTGSLQIERSDFTKFCDLLFKDGYVISGEAKTKVE